MAVSRFFGHHVSKPGRPAVFRTTGGRLLHHDHFPDAMTIESLFSRKGETANLDAVKQQHSNAVSAFDATKHDTIHITNNSAHIERLNDGWSAQTSAGFFERALLEAKKAVLGAWKLKAVP